MLAFAINSVMIILIRKAPRYLEAPASLGWGRSASCSPAGCSLLMPDAGLHLGAFQPVWEGE